MYTQTEPRSVVRQRDGQTKHHGTTWAWHRVVRGTYYSYSLTVMPNGEVRVTVKGYQHDPSDKSKFDCDFNVLQSYTIK